MDIPDEDAFAGLSIGDDVDVHISGKVTELRAPYMTEDYDYEPKKGEKRKMKKRPGTMGIELDADPNVSNIRQINDALRSEDAD
jgi:hypothetical protein